MNVHELQSKPQSGDPVDEIAKDTNGEFDNKINIEPKVSFKIPSDDSEYNSESDGSNEVTKSQGSRTSHRRDTFRAVERKGSLGRAGGKCSRLGAYFRQCFRCSRHRNDAYDNDQYYIPPPEEENETVFDAFHQLYSGAFDDLSMWLYGASFWKILLFYWILYMLFVVIFVFVLYLADRINLNDPNKSGGGCINNNREEGVLPLHAQLEFAFELSWTTFTTVGYGSIAPPGDEVECYNVRTVCSFEAIFGMAFHSICSGLFYAKLTRLLGEMPVTFSSTLCIQYGKGLIDAGNRYRPLTEEFVRNYTRKNSNPDTSGTGGGFVPFPVIEFRVVNNRANNTHGQNEIFDANCSAIVQISLAKDSAFCGDDQTDIALPSRWTSVQHSSATAIRKNEKVFYTLPFKPSFNPFFNRVWILQHTLDSSSPLLRREIRKDLRLRGKDRGWDPSLNNHRSIRAALVEFSSIRVVLNGGSALSKSEVYAEKIYSYDDICVGWQHFGVCYDMRDKTEGFKKLQWRRRRTDTGADDEEGTKVDFSLIHDIVPQRGGDFEPLDLDENLLQVSMRRNSLNKTA